MKAYKLLHDSQMLVCTVLVMCCLKTCLGIGFGFALFLMNLMRQYERLKMDKESNIK